MNIEGFEIGDPIGHGGMGSVFVAKQMGAGGRTVALKVIQANYAQDEAFRSRFEAEMKVAAALQHPNIVPVYEAKESQGQPYIAMALIQGEDLGSMIRRNGQLDPQFAVRVISQVASALDAAHSENIIHRDVKPGNILIDERTDHAYLSDFGIAKSLEASRAETKTGEGLGSIHYIAPEQLEGKDPDQRSDVYALGCVLFQCLTSELPYRDGSEVFVLRQKLDEEPRLPTELRPDLGPNVDEVLMSALARNPDERFQTPGDLAGAAEAALLGGSSARVEHGPGGAATMRLPTGGGNGHAPTRVQPRTKEPTRRLGPKALGIAGVVALVLAAFAISRGGDGDSATETSPTSAPKAVTGSSSGQQFDSSPPANAPATAAPEPKAALPLETAYTNDLIADIPEGWFRDTIDERNETDSGGVRITNIWRDPMDPDTSVLIDTSEATGMPVLESAASVRDAVSQGSGYQEIAFREIYLGDRPTAEWIFDQPEDRRVDYFFEECGQGFAVLGVAPRDRFGDLAPTFKRVAASVSSYCD